MAKLSEEAIRARLLVLRHASACWRDDLVIAIRENVPDAVVIQSPCTMGKGQQADLRKYVAKLELNQEHRVLFAQTVVGMDRP